MGRMTAGGGMTLSGGAGADGRPAAGTAAARGRGSRSTCSSGLTMRRSCSSMRTGSTKLPAGEKLLIWHLYQAALAGRDIYYDQRYAHNLEMRDVLEEILTHPGRDRSRDAGRDPALHQAVLAEQRPVQQPHRPQVRPQVHARGVRRGGADRREERRRDLRPAAGESLDAMLARLQPAFFDAARRADRDQQDARPGQGHPRRRAPTTSTSASR